MNNQSYGGIQWIQHHVTSGDLKSAAAAAQLIADAQQLQVTEILESNGDDDDDGNTAEYMIGDDDAADLDQMAAENLIFMARDGQMVNEIMTGQDGDTVVVSAGNETSLELEQAAALVQSPALIVESDAYATNSTLVVFGEDTPQMVTEEVITDDWVQHQGEERVEIPAEQILGSNSSHVLLDMVQDEYTALRPYPCDFCSRRFRKKASLNNHMIAHQNDRPHLCKLCGARFSRRAELINHFKAHAEQQYADEAEVRAEVVKFEPQRRQMDDHYYEQDWQLQQPALSVCEPLHHERDMPLAESISANSSSSVSTITGTTVSTSNSASTSTATMTRGRVSRLKPKEDTQFMIVEQKATATDLDYLGCQDLQAATAAVKLTQDQSPAHEPNFPIIDDSKPFVCQQCGLAFAREKALNSHVKNHREDSPFECNQCNEMFWDTSSLHEHQKSHQFEESNSEYDPVEGEIDDSQSDSGSEQLYGEFYCAECGISFHRQDLLRRHTKQHKQKPVASVTSTATTNVATSGHAANKDAQHCCNTCGETFAEALDLLAHAEIHARFPPFKCVLCGESFYEEQAIKRHLHTRHAHEMTANSCILCGKECRDRKALIKHAWDHSREKCHSCSKCGKNFHNKARLKRHMASHRDKSVICDVCQEEFPDGRTLSNHRHSHSTSTSGKLFPCPECNKTFGSRSSQQIHVRIHTGERPYGCRFCWKAFADGGTLRKHERIHTGEKPYACSVCPRAFNQRVVLREHIRSHHSGKDMSRGTYYCTVCGAELTSSNELIQHLIQHSDLNTAKQRQPVSGPRKYKRRRKLQPHEIAHLRAECKSENFGSDLDISDFDMDTVDDLLGINAEPVSKAASKRKTKKTESSVPVKRGAHNKSGRGGTKAEVLPATSPTTVGTTNNNYNNNNNNNACGKERYDSTNSSNSDKIWEAKFLQSTVNNQENSLFNNVEQGLQTIDALVVHSQKTRRAKKVSDSGAQRTQEVQFKSETNKAASGGNNNKSSTSRAMETSCNGAVTRSRKKTNSKTQSKTSARPRMIHTEKWRTTSGQEAASNGIQKRTRSKTSYITRTETTTNIDLLTSKAGTTSSTNIVDDYEIISPATQPPNQISSSPLHIKQEHDQQQQQRMHNSQHHEQNQLQQIYEAHLLLEASSLRKETYEKFNPSIVNDLEEILRSPLKCERNVRHRFISESSTTPQYLPEDEQHLIKIEPTSPDLREIVESQRNISAAGTSARTTQLRQITGNGTRDLQLQEGRSMQHVKANNALHQHQQQQLHQQQQQLQSHNSSNGLRTDISNANTTANAMKAANAVANAAAASAYLNYSVDSFSVGVTGEGVSNVDVASQYFSISEVVSAADATEAAAAAAKAAAASAKSERKVRQFECEMCSAVFYDRTQLLEHVHIHI